MENILSLEIIEPVSPKAKIPKTPVCTNEFTPEQLSAYLKQCAAKAKKFAAEQSRLAGR